MLEQSSHTPNQPEHQDLVLAPHEKPVAYLERLKSIFTDPVQQKWLDILFSLERFLGEGVEIAKLTPEHQAELQTHNNLALASMKQHLQNIFELEKAEHLARVTGKKRVESIGLVPNLIRQTSIRLVASLSQLMFPGGIQSNLEEKAALYAKNSPNYRLLSNAITALTTLKNRGPANVTAAEADALITQLNLAASSLEVPDVVVDAVREAAKRVG